MKFKIQTLFFNIIFQLKEITSQREYEIQNLKTLFSTRGKVLQICAMKFKIQIIISKVSM